MELTKRKTRRLKTLISVPDNNSHRHELQHDYGNVKENRKINN